MCSLSAMDAVTLGREGNDRGMSCKHDRIVYVVFCFNGMSSANGTTIPVSKVMNLRTVHTTLHALQHCTAFIVKTAMNL